MLPEERMRLGVVREALREQRADCHALGRQRLLHELEERPKLRVAAVEGERPRLLAEIDQRSRAARASVEQHLKDAEGEIDHRRVRRVQQRAAQPQRRVGPLRAREAAAVRAALLLGRQSCGATFDLGVDGVHDGLAQGGGLVGRGRAPAWRHDGRQHLEQVLHQLVELGEALRWQPDADLDSREAG